MDNAQAEPSMEEILASIRRIISEDEEEAAGATASSGPASKKSEPVKSASPSLAIAPGDDDGADDAAATELPANTEELEMTKENLATVEPSTDEESPILDTTSAAAASSAFEALSQSVRVSDAPGRSLEDIVVEMLRPMVKEWLDANLPAIVEEKVEEEVRRVARRRR